MTLRIYTYSRCDSCRKALRFLADRGIDVENFPIRETPPSRSELATMLQAYHHDLRKLFNTSGRDYRSMGLSERLPRLTVDEAFDLLTTHGNLVKRPFLIGDGVAQVGFRPEAWSDLTS